MIEAVAGLAAVIEAVARLAAVIDGGHYRTVGTIAGELTPSQKYDGEHYRIVCGHYRPHYWKLGLESWNWPWKCEIGRGKLKLGTESWYRNNGHYHNSGHYRKAGPGPRPGR